MFFLKSLFLSFNMRLTSYFDPVFGFIFGFLYHEYIQFSSRAQFRSRAPCDNTYFWHLIFAFGYCKYADSRSYKHVTLVCDDGQCDFKSCDKRHFEKVIDKQRQELKENKFYISELELRLGEIEKKFKED